MFHYPVYGDMRARIRDLASTSASTRSSAVLPRTRALADARLSDAIGQKRAAAYVIDGPQFITSMRLMSVID